MMKQCSVCKRSKDCRTYDYYVLNACGSSRNYAAQTTTLSWNLNDKKLVSINLCNDCIEKKMNKTKTYFIVSLIIAIIISVYVTFSIVIPGKNPHTASDIFLYFLIFIYPILAFISYKRWMIPRVREKRISTYSREILIDKYGGKQTVVWGKNEKPPF